MKIVSRIKLPIENEMELFEKKFTDSMASKVSLLNRITHYVVNRKGKQMRPMFVFLTAKLLNDGEVNERTYRGASVIELIHTATLVHDDVVDDANYRRGFFSVNALWKNKIAVLVGDYLLSKGLLLSLNNDDFELLKIVSNAVKEMSEGELLQIEKARRLDIDESIYFDIIRQKTASLIASCCAVGAASAGASKEEIEKAIEVLFANDYSIEDRTLISLDSDLILDPDMRLFDGTAFGLNEFTIHKRDTSSMITVHTYIDEEYLNSYWADGLIVSTPTGSTGYSLSCGGPLISPTAKNFVITPVSPHNLNVRPIIVADDSVISFKIEGRSEKFLISLDSRSTAVDANVHLKVRKEKFVAKLVKFYDYSFFDTLRQKLNWGYDMRN